jgi:membrane protein DedA with SNARE-associated domain
MDWTHAFSPWGIYPIIVAAPFVQEDTAVVATATAAISGADIGACYGLLVLGIALSDIFKYWLGRSAHFLSWSRALAERSNVLAAKERVLRHLGVALLIARFVPGTRIPIFLAAGFFRAPFARAALIIVASAAVYAGAVFAVFLSLGATMGEQARRVLPIAALTIVALVMAFQFIAATRARRAAAMRT